MGPILQNWRVPLFKCYGFPITFPIFSISGNKPLSNLGQEMFILAKLPLLANRMVTKYQDRQLLKKLTSEQSTNAKIFKKTPAVKSNLQVMKVNMLWEECQRSATCINLFELTQLVWVQSGLDNICSHLFSGCYHCFQSGFNNICFLQNSWGDCPAKTYKVKKALANSFDLFLQPRHQMIVETTFD